MPIKLPNTEPIRLLAAHGDTGFRSQLRDKTDPAREHLVTLLAFNVPRAAKP